MRSSPARSGIGPIIAAAATTMTTTTPRGSAKRPVSRGSSRPRAGVGPDTQGCYSKRGKTAVGHRGFRFVKTVGRYVNYRRTDTCCTPLLISYISVPPCTACTCVQIGPADRCVRRVSAFGRLSGGRRGPESRTAFVRHSTVPCTRPRWPRPT